jgi:hypothetical protein
MLYKGDIERSCNQKQKERSPNISSVYQPPTKVLRPLEMQQIPPIAICPQEIQMKVPESNS